jgi:hypothetical protein
MTYNIIIMILLAKLQTQLEDDSIPVHVALLEQE